MLKSNMTVGYNKYIVVSSVPTNKMVKDYFFVILWDDEVNTEVTNDVKSTSNS